MKDESRPVRCNDFARFWFGQAVSSLGDSFSGFALPLLVYHMTGSALNLAISSAMTFLPYLLFGLLIGAWVDRADRRRLMLATDVVRAMLIASIPLLSFAGFFALPYVYAVQFIIATLGIGFMAAQTAALPSLVGGNDLPTANGRIIAAYSVAGIVGPLLAGMLAAVMPLQTLLLFDAGSFLVSALALSRIRTSFNRSQLPVMTSIRHDIAEGLRYVWQQPVIRALTLLLLLLNTVGPTVRVQLVVFAKQRLSASDTQVGMLWSAASVGVLLCSLVAGRLRRWPLGRVALGAIAAHALLLFAFSQTRMLWLALPLWGAQNGAGVVVDIAIMSLRQQIVPDGMLGRVTTVSRTIGFAANPLSTLLGGVLVDRLGDVALVYSAVAVLTLLVALGFRFSALALPPGCVQNG